MKCIVMRGWFCRGRLGRPLRHRPVARARIRGNRPDLSRGHTRHERAGARQDEGLNGRPGRYQPGDQLLGFLNSL